MGYNAYSTGAAKWFTTHAVLVWLNGLQLIQYWCGYMVYNAYSTGVAKWFTMHTVLCG